MPDRDLWSGAALDEGRPVFCFKCPHPQRGELAARLSPREAQSLTMAAHGLTDREIARRLGLMPRTVRVYLARARDKLGAVNTTHAVFLATLAGLILFDSFLVDATVDVAV